MKQFNSFKTSRLWLAPCTVLLSLSLAACGGGGDDNTDTTEAAKPSNINIAPGVKGSAGIVPGSKDLGAIWFIGDSITQSNADEDGSGSPRKALFDLLLVNRYYFSYTGSSKDNTDGLPAVGVNGLRLDSKSPDNTPDKNLFQYHSGYSGSFVGGMADNLNKHWKEGRLATVKPNVVLILLGANDADRGGDMVTVPTRLGDYIDAISKLAGDKQPTFMIGTITPNRRTDKDQAKRVSDFNAKLPGLVSDRKSKGMDIHLVDIFKAVNDDYANSMRDDNLHPNAKGNVVMAQQWFAKIEEIVKSAPPR